MKTILALTDHTENAIHAAKSAVMLAGALNTNLLLYNTKLILPVATYYADYAGGPWVVDDFTQSENDNKEKMRQLAEDLQPLIAKLDPQLRKPFVHYESSEGSLAQNITDIIEKNNIELIVMGASSDSTFEHILNGSDTRAIIDHAACPVLIIPQNSDLKKLKKVIFATDFDEADIKGIHYLVKIGKLFDFKIEIVHVCPYGEKEGSVAAKEEDFFKHVDKLRYPHIRYKEIKGKNVIRRLNDLCDEDDANILALVHYQHSFFVRLFEHSITRDALLHQNIPLLIFPSKMEKDYKEFV